VIETELGERPGDPTGAVEPSPEFGPLQPGLGDAPFATHQGAQRKLDPQGARADLAALVRAAELDAVQHDGRGRKQAGIDRTGDPEIEPGQAGGPGLELPAIAAPIDKEGPYQRRHQRQDDCKRETEQRRLHALSTAAGLPKSSHWAVVRRPRKA
jgi:hypothetical protein